MSGEDPFQGLFEKVARSGVESLSERERRVFRVNCFLCDLDNGGLSGFLYNVSPAAGEPQEWCELRAVAAAARELGSAEVGSSLEGAAQLLESRLVATASTWGEALGPLQAELDSLEAKLNEGCGRLWELAEAEAAELTAQQA